MAEHEHVMVKHRQVTRTGEDGGYATYEPGQWYLKCECGYVQPDPRVEYRAVTEISRSRVFRFENGQRVGSSVFSGGFHASKAMAKELNAAVATGVRLALDGLDRNAAADAFRRFDWDDYGLDGMSHLLQADPDAQEWVDALAADVIRSLGGTCA